MQKIDGCSTAVTVRFATDAEIGHWDELVLEAPDEGNAFRCQANIARTRQLGVEPVYLIIDGVATTAFRVDVKPLGSYWVVIGPAVQTVGELVDTAKALAAFAADHGVAAVRVRPQLIADEDSARVLREAGLTRVPSWIPDHTIIIDLAGSEEELLARFGKRARRGIRRAQREGVTVERVPSTPENTKVLNNLLAATADERFPHPGLEAVAALVETWTAADAGQLFLARHDGEVVAAAFSLRFGVNCVDLIGGSVRRSPSDSSRSGIGVSGAGHALQWAILQWAHEHGCVRCDLYGTPSTQFIDDKTHPIYGVGQFKRGFNSEVTDYLGSYQISAKRARAWLIWQLELSIERAKYSRLLNKRLRSAPQPNPDHVWLH